MTRHSKLLLVVLISAAHLAVCLVAIAWLFGCLQNTNQKQILSEVAHFNRSSCGQAVAHIESQGFSEFAHGSSDLEQLQEFLKNSSHTDGSFVSVVDATGQIVGHPSITGGNRLIGSKWDKDIVDRSKRDFLSQLNDSILEDERGVLMSNGSSFYLAHGQFVPELGVHVVSHRVLPELNTSMLDILRGFSFAGMLAMGLLVTVLNIFVTKRIAVNDIRIQSKLERLVDERTDELERTKNAIVFGLAKLAESRDNDTGQHLDRIQKYVTILATDLESVYEDIDSEFIKNLAVASHCMTLARLEFQIQFC